MSYYRQQLEDWLKSLDVKADTVLDIGGAQGPVKGRTKSWDVKDYQILDLPEYDLDYTEFEDWIGDFYGKSSEIIFCLEVFEYLINPLAAINKIEYCLKKGGKAYITFAFVYPFHEEVDRDSLRYTENAIVRLADLAGLTISNIHYRVDRTNRLEAFYVSDGMHPAKGYHHHNATGFIVEFTK